VFFRVFTTVYNVTSVWGTPGGYAFTLGFKRSLKSVGFFAGAFSLGAGSIFLFLNDSVPQLILMFLAASSFACFFYARNLWGDAQKAFAGARSEKRASSVILKTKPDFLMNSVLLGAGGDADHIVLGPKLVVIETKTGRGKVSYKDGVMRAGTKKIPGDPVAQANRQALALSKESNTFASAIVCVTE